ncbi:membrane protein insertase YidC [Mycoplasma todarodis]|uniref:Membrane insertase YidC/Oxa/ALB C-terminal domain-containing protein n=1 Tax=Mycoplasma todarodis TaxID=1937191 RepID=A0A4R0XT22_9MOLU|nr:membrane protein insertase YidC [Mycoplasma todarodis]TCG11610.1 hypothetical protein C4B25_01365 [Mycoplasma todarodis]
MKNNTKKQGGNYDWFQNGGNTKQAKTPKQMFKKMFKIFKIFIYISLAALSLTGCVQSFVIGTTNYSGQGMELYESKDRITPHVTTYNIKKGEVTRDSKLNYYLKDDKELKEVHSYVEQNGGDMSTWKTENNAVQIKVDGKTIEKDQSIVHFNGKPLVASESQKKSGLGAAYKTKEIPVWTYDKDTKMFTGLKKLKLKQRQAKGERRAGKKDVKSEMEDQLEIDLQTATFDKLFQALFMDANGKYNAIYKDLNNAPTSVKEGDAKYDTVLKYYAQLQKISKSTGVTLADKNHESTELKNAEAFESLVTSSDLGFGLSPKNSLRAIYDWDTSWKLGPFYGLFVYPLSRLVLALVGSFPMMSGWESLLAIAIAVIIIRTFAYMLTFKSTLQQVKQQELSSKKAAIEAKYAQYKGNKQMEQRKRQEMSEMFKKEGISPLGSIGSIFLTMPIFLAMWKIIGGIPHLKSTSWLGIHFSETSWRELFHGEFQYLPLMLVAATVQGISIYIPRLLTKRRDKNRINAHQKAALKKANKTQNIMMAVFVFMALIFSAGLQVYWIFGGLFTIVQNLVNHKIIKWQSRRNKEKRIKAA